MKFGQWIEYTVRNSFLQKSWRNSGRKTSLRPLFVFEKLYINLKQVVSTLVKYILVVLDFDIQLKQTVQEIQTVNPEICLILFF